MPVSAESVFVYLEKEPGQEPAISKFTLDKNFLRIDSGRDGGFVLFDRNKKEVFSVSGFDKTIMVIAKRLGSIRSPIKIDFKVEKKEINVRIFSSPLLHHRFYANGQRCSDLFSVVVPNDGLLDTLKEFYNILALEHAQVLETTPTDVLDACDLSLYVVHSNFRLKYGLPSQEIDYTGKHRILLDFDLDYEAPAGWQRLPDGYEQYHPGQIRGIDLDA